MKHNKLTKSQLKLFSKILLLQIAFLISSCENEKYDSGMRYETKNYDFEVKNGRLHFQSKESFAHSYNEYVNLPEEKLSELLMPYYKKGFYSLRPVVTEKNEEFLYNHYKTKLNLDTPRGRTSKSSDTAPPPDFPPVDDDPLGPVEFIGDDTFAAYLNIDGEIQIGEEIYKYTDVGLFIADETEYSTLEDYLGSENISQDPFVETDLTVKENVVLVLPENYPTPIGVHSQIVYYRPSNTGQSGSTPTTFNSAVPGSVISTDPSYNSFFSNLSSCNPHSGLFGNLFGDNDVCIDQYESKRRVKTKAFNYNYLLVYHMGVKCVHQFKGWTGFWRVEATDEIRLVVEAVQFEYDRNKLIGNTVINNQTRERAYFMSGQRAFFAGPNNININNEWGQPIISYANLTSLPQVFHDDLTFEFFGTGSSYIDGLIQNGIDSNLKASKFNEWFYSGLYSTAKSQLQTAFGSSTTPPTNRTFAAKFPENGKIIVQKSITSQGTNIGVREKTFDWGVQLCFNGGDTSGWSIQPDMGCDLIVKPSNFKVKIVGAARKGTQWHGSKFGVGIN